MTYDRIEKAEPAILTGVVASLGGFLALLAADFSTLHSAALAFGLSGTQAFLTRPTVFSPKSIKALESGAISSGQVIELLRSGTALPHPGEPAVTIGTLTLLGGFLAQIFSGVDFLSAFVSAAGISGLQTTATRARVSSPLTAREALARRLLGSAAPGGGTAVLPQTA